MVGAYITTPVSIRMVTVRSGALRSSGLFNDGMFGGRISSPIHSYKIPKVATAPRGASELRRRPQPPRRTTRPQPAAPQGRLAAAPGHRHARGRGPTDNAAIAQIAPALLALDRQEAGAHVT